MNSYGSKKKTLLTRTLQVTLAAGTVRQLLRPNPRRRHLVFSSSDTVRVTVGIEEKAIVDNGIIVNASSEGTIRFSHHADGCMIEDAWYGTTPSLFGATLNIIESEVQGDDE